MEKIATLRSISPLVGLELSLIPVAGVCSIFLFSTLYGEKNGRVNSAFETIYGVSIAGILALSGIVILEIYSSVKAQKRIIRAKTSQNLILAQAEEEEEVGKEGEDGEELVEEVNGIYVGFSFSWVAECMPRNFVR